MMRTAAHEAGRQQGHTTNDANEQILTVAKGYKRKFESMTPQRATALACVRKNGHLALPEKRQVYKTGKKQHRAPQPVRSPAPPPPR